jgi:two-component system invasion response regulator UvrY
MEKKSICLVDDHMLVREGLKALVESTEDLVIESEYENGEDFLAAIEEGKTWDLVMLDICMPKVSGLKALSELKERGREQKCVVLSMLEDEKCMIKSYYLGARGYITKNMSGEGLLSCIKEVFGGKRLYPDKLGEDVDKADKLYGTLSRREREVLSFLSEGLSIKEVSSRLKLSTKTVSTYKSRLMQKLDLKNNFEIFEFLSRSPYILNDF